MQNDVRRLIISVARAEQKCLFLDINKFSLLGKPWWKITHMLPGVAFNDLVKQCNPVSPLYGKAASIISLFINWYACSKTGKYTNSSWGTLTVSQAKINIYTLQIRPLGVKRLCTDYKH